MQTINQIEGSVALFVHWSANDKISKVDQSLIAALENMFDFVLVVKNLNQNKSIDNPIYDKGIKTIHLDRQNIGYDFGGYVAGMKQLASQKELLTEVLILNNSVYLAVPNLDKIISKVRGLGSNVTSMTSSNEINDHLQSYFIHFDKTCLANFDFWEYWEKVETYDDKSLTIQNLELGLASYMEDIGLSTGSLFEYSYVTNFALSPPGLALAVDHRNDSGIIHALDSAQNLIPLNPTHYFWFWLRELGFPFLKKDLLRDFGDLGLGLENWSSGIPEDFAKNIESELKNKNLRR